MKILMDLNHIAEEENEMSDSNSSVSKGDDKLQDSAK